MNSITSVTPAELHTLISAGEEPDIIDVRTPSEYRSGHIYGARSVPLDDVQAGRFNTAEANANKDTNTTVYITCHSGSRARQAAERLVATGIRNITLLEGGTQAWEQSGLPVKRCGNAISLERQVQIAIGSLIVLEVIFGFTVHELFFALSALIGSGLIVACITRWCGMAQLIARLPWNRHGDCTEKATV